jgi:sarcosine oxidase subunit beta
MAEPNRVAVVGGGAVGVTAAHELASDGVDVTLFERDELAAGASGRAAGICYDAFAERVDADVAARAMARFRDLAAETRLPFTARPYVWLARTGDDRRAEAIREQVPRMRAHGRDVELLAATDLAEPFPALETSDVAVAAIAHDAACTDPALYTTVVAERAEAAGATVHTETPVALESGPSSGGAGPTLETPTGRETFDAVLVAAGAHTKHLLADAGIPIPVKPYRVQALVTETTPASADAPMLYDATHSFYCRPEDGGFLVGDGTEPHEFDPDDYDPTADDSFVTDALARLRDALAPDAVAPTETRRAWAGLCTATPDRDPLLGAVSPDVYVATGWHGHGFMRAPALGTTIAEQIRGSDGIEPFDPMRFDGDEEFQVVEGMTVD